MTWGPLLYTFGRNVRGHSCCKESTRWALYGGSRARDRMCVFPLAPSLTSGDFGHFALATVSSSVKWKYTFSELLGKGMKIDKVYGGVYDL